MPPITEPAPLIREIPQLAPQCHVRRVLRLSSNHLLVHPPAIWHACRFDSPNRAFPDRNPARFQKRPDEVLGCDSNITIEARFAPKRVAAAADPARPRIQRFATIEAARTWVQGFATWYNLDHRHSALRFVTPDQRHRGEDRGVLASRHQVYELARAARRTQHRRRDDRRSEGPDLGDANPRTVPALRLSQSRLPGRNCEGHLCGRSCQATGQDGACAIFVISEARGRSGAAFESSPALLAGIRPHGKAR